MLHRHKHSSISRRKHSRRVNCSIRHTHRHSCSSKRKHRVPVPCMVVLGSGQEHMLQGLYSTVRALPLGQLPAFISSCLLSCKRSSNGSSSSRSHSSSWDSSHSLLCCSSIRLVHLVRTMVPVPKACFSSSWGNSSTGLVLLLVHRTCRCSSSSGSHLQVYKVPHSSHQQMCKENIATLRCLNRF